MALFEGARRVQSTATDERRTNNRLVISDEIVMVADKWLADPRLPKKFRYQFGGDSGWVVIPKGKIVALVPDQTFKEFESQKMYNALTIANGGEDVVEDNQYAIDRGSRKPGDLTYTRVGNIPVGVAPYNIYQKIDDRFHGNIPTFLRRSYIELPWIKDIAAADQCKWGHVRAPELRPGEFLKSDKHGNFVKWDPKNDCISQRVAQVLSIEQNMPPEGWLQWVYRTEEWGIRPWQNRYGKDTNTSGFRAEDLGMDGFPYDPAYKDGFPRKRPFGNMYGPEPLEGLHDGSLIESPVADELVGTLPVDATLGDTLYFRAASTPIVSDSVALVIKKNGDTIDITDMIDRIDYESGLIKVVIDNSADLAPVLGGSVFATYKATGQIPGLPRNWDQLGSTGVVRLDLMF